MMPTASPGNRLDAGAAILAAARAIDVRLVKLRLAKFERANRAYADAQRKVEAAEAQLRVAQERLSERDVDQDEAVEALARALVAAGRPRANPFTAFGDLAPGAVMRMPFGEEAKEVRRLAAAVQREKSASKLALAAAQAATRAAQAVEAALPAVAKLEVVVREARHTRDAVGQTWESALAALKRGARAAADDGAPELYATLFARLVRPAKRDTKPAPAPSPPEPGPVPATVPG